ncbi:hypothetical protein IC615_12620 [Serratia ureilytica]
MGGILRADVFSGESGERNGSQSDSSSKVLMVFMFVIPVKAD